MTSESSISIDALLAELGVVTQASRDLAREALESAGLTNARKRNIAARKRDEVVSLINERFARVCSDARCQRVIARDPRPKLVTERFACEVCRGSSNTAAVEAMAAALVDAGRPRLLVVGGSPNARSELEKLLARTGVETQLVDGTVAISSTRADQWVAWADVVVVWGGTQLAHKVSTHFMKPEYSSKRLTLASRGMASLSAAVVEHLEGGRQRPPTRRSRR
jgi:hypothetical protein